MQMLDLVRTFDETQLQAMLHHTASKQVETVTAIANLAIS